MTAEAYRELEDWIVAECYRMASGAAAPYDWIEPRGRRDAECRFNDYPPEADRVLALSEILLNYFRLEPSRAYHAGSPSNECFPDTPRFREAVEASARAIGRLTAEGVLVRATGGYRLAAPWVDLMAACEGAPADGRGGAEHCGRCHERI